MNSGTSCNFHDQFKALTGNSPFCWQRRLFREYFAKGAIPAALDIPTGLGKTSVMVLWYLAQITGAKVPRRLIYVVDRRAVVDQATAVADEIREKSQDSALRISTLRGQHVDNREWLADPAAPSIVVGTVDMIGSRLLFSGYGVSRKMRPYHAGLLGADTLVVLDEAHLVPPFEKLLERIANGAEAFGPREHDGREIVPPFKLLSLSATGREDSPDRLNEKMVFRLSSEDMADETVKKRLEARKRLVVQVLDAEPKLVPQLVERAWSLGTERGRARVLIYCDRREDALKVKSEVDEKFKKEKREHISELLVGGRRVFEREALFDWLKKHGFLGDAKGKPKQPTFLIATSAGEVGVDLDADHMVCDLVEWERMVQRLGRVNRRGNGDARIEVIVTPRKKEKAEEWTERLVRLHKPLDSLRRVGAKGERDASPGAILDLKERTENCSELEKAIEAATTPIPLRPALTRALVDAWSLTSLDKHTGRPDDIQPWLRGWEEDQQPQTTVVWRKYLPIRGDGPEVTEKDIEAFFEATPPHASEKLETETYRVVDWLVKRLTKTVNGQLGLGNNILAYILSPSGEFRDTVHGHSLIREDAKEKKKAKVGLEKNLVGSTLVVDMRLGGLSEEGMLDENADSSPRAIDNGQEWLPPRDDKPVIRFRVRSVTGEENRASDGDWRERYRFTTEQSDEGEVQRFLLVEKWRHDAETEDDRSVGHLQELTEHHAWTERKARTLADAIGLPGEYADMLATAAKLHDEGKRHSLWQQAAKVPADGKFYAKTNRRMNTKLLDGYRHEFGSLPYAKEDAGFRALPNHLQELALHLVAAHHGWARPVISISGCDVPPSVSEKRARDIALRFAQLQKRWGPWGLAWWEALLRAADQQASRENDELGKHLKHDAGEDA